MKVRVRMYHVRFGDCFVVSFYGERTYRVLVDCGVHDGSKKPDTSKGEPTFKDVVGRMLADSTDADGVVRFDVVVASHRHRDHVRGFEFASLWKDVEVKEVWMPWVENDRDPIAGAVRDAQDELARRTHYALRARRAARGGEVTEREKEVLDIAYNNTTNRIAMQQLRSFPGARMRYLPRAGYRPDLLDAELQGVLPPGCRVHVLGPSHDPRVIKKLDPPNDEVFGPRARKMSSGDEDVIGDIPKPCAADWESGEEVYEFSEGEREDLRRLSDSVGWDAFDLTYRVDGAVNGTSLILLFEVDDVKLLFPGDAQWGGWQVILEDKYSRELLTGTTVYKVGHHGSHNATPRAFVDEVLANRRLRAAMVSVAPTSYKGGWQRIPEAELIDALRTHADVVLISNPPTSPPADGGLVEPLLYTDYELDTEAK